MYPTPVFRLSCADERDVSTSVAVCKAEERKNRQSESNRTTSEQHQIGHKPGRLYDPTTLLPPVCADARREHQESAWGYDPNSMISISPGPLPSEPAGAAEGSRKLPQAARVQLREWPRVPECVPLRVGKRVQAAKEQGGSGASLRQPSWASY